MYQWSNLLGRDDAVSVVEESAYRWFAEGDRAEELMKVFSRKRAPTEVFTAPRLARWVASAARRTDVDKRLLGRAAFRDVRREVSRMVEQRMFTRRRAASAASMSSEVKA